MNKKVTTAAEYRKTSRKIVELPSGAIFEIRKLSPIVYGDALEKMGIDTTAEDSNLNRRIFELMRHVIPRCVVNPKIIVDAVKDDELDYEDIDQGDLTALLEAIYEFSGLTQKDQEEREEFLEEPDSESG